MTPNPELLLQEARAGDADTLGRLLELYRRYLALLARVQIGKRLQGKVDASDIVQETFLDAHRNFAHFRGASEAQLIHWLRQILAAKLADLLRRYLGAQGRDVRLEREIENAFEHSSVLLDRGLEGRVVGRRRDLRQCLCQALLGVVEVLKLIEEQRLERIAQMLQQPARLGLNQPTAPLEPLAMSRERRRRRPKQGWSSPLCDCDQRA